MSRARNRGAPLGRLLDAASQPLYILDEDRKLVFYNAAFRRWLGATAEELVGRRCAYHSAPGASGIDALLAGLCPPPAAFSGQRCSGVVTHEDARGQVRRRRAVFAPLGDVGELIAVIAVVDDLDLPADYDEVVSSEPALDESQVLHELLRRLHREQSAEHSLGSFVGNSPAVRRARSQATLAMNTRSTVAISGPKGCGKERLAKTIHFGSEQAGAVIPLDCAVLGGDLVRSTVIALAAQDVDSETPGRNTLLLNGADAIGPDAQSELARVFFERPFPLRIITMSEQRLTESAGRGEYDEVLALGVSTLEVELPALAKRIRDLPLLVQMFVEEINAEGGKQIGGAASETLDMLAAYGWPGNLDELRATIAEAHEHAETHEIRPSDIPERIRLALDAAARPRRKETAIQLDEYLAEIERELIERAMIQTKGNKTKAASLLGLNRPRLYRRLLQLGLIDEESGDTNED